MPPTRKAQQELLLDSFQELTKKFTDLHMKLNSLQQQVKSQKDLQIAIEQTVAKAVKQAMPDMIKKQVEDTVAPLLQKQQEMLE